MREDEEKFGEYHELNENAFYWNDHATILDGVLVLCTCKNKSKQVFSNTHPMLKIFLSDLAVLNLMEDALCLFRFMSDHERKRSLNLNVIEKAGSETAISSPSLTSSESFLARLGLVCSSKNFGA